MYYLYNSAAYQQPDSDSARLYNGYSMYSTKKGRKDLSDPINKKLYRLPSESEIMRRLEREVHGKYAKAFPIIAREGDKQYSPAEIAFVFTQPIRRASENGVSTFGEMFRTVLHAVDVLVDDPEIAETVRGILNKRPYAPRLPRNWDGKLSWNAK